MTLKFKTCMHGYESCENCHETHAQEIAKLQALCDKMAGTLEYIAQPHYVCKTCGKIHQPRKVEGYVDQWDNNGHNYNEIVPKNYKEIAREALKEYSERKGK